MYGGRQFPTFDQGWIGWFALQALIQKNDPNSEPFTIAGTGKQVRDVLHADDVVNVYWAAVDNIDRAAGQAFVIGGGPANSLSLLELFSLLRELVGMDLRYTKNPPRPSDQKVFVASNQKASKVLGWQPRKAAKAGIEAMLSWVGEMGLG